MRRKISGLLCLVLALMMVVGSVPAMAETIDQFTVVFENIGTGYVVNYDANKAMSGLSGHQFKTHCLVRSEVDPAEFKFTSSKKNVASIDASGIVTLKKAGTTVIKITPKSNKKAALKFTLKVNNNGVSYKNLITAEDKAALKADQAGIALAKKFYVKGGKVLVDLYVFNGSRYSVGGSSQNLQFAYYRNIENTNDVKIINGANFKFKGTVKAGKAGLATATIPKEYLDPAKEDLRKSFGGFSFNVTPKTVKGIEDIQAKRIAELAKDR